MKKIILLFLILSYASNATELVEAIKSSSIQRVSQLIKDGVDVNEQDEEGNSPIHYSIRENSTVEILQLLIKNDALVNKLDANLETPIHIAIDKKKGDFIKLLVNNSADLNLISNGKLPLNIAIKTGQESIVRLFVKKDVLINNTDILGEHSLFYFFKSVNIDNGLLKLLKSHDVALEIKNKEGRTAFYNAIDDIKKYDLYEEFFPVNFNQRDKAGVTPLMLIASSKNYDVFLKGIDNQGDITLKDNDSRNIFHYALKGNNNIVEFLFKQQRSNPNETNKLGLTPLLSLCKNFNNTYLSNLVSCINHGCNLDSQGEKNYSSLMYLIEKGNFPTAVKELVQAGANKNIINSDGKTALDMAIERNLTSIIEILKN